MCQWYTGEPDFRCIELLYEVVDADGAARSMVRFGPAVPAGPQLAARGEGRPGVLQGPDGSRVMELVFFLVIYRRCVCIGVWVRACVVALTPPASQVPPPHRARVSPLLHAVRAHGTAAVHHVGMRLELLLQGDAALANGGAGCRAPACTHGGVAARGRDEGQDSSLSR